jgi:predicted DNA-binding transcriptional regulator AlpA
VHKSGKLATHDDKAHIVTEKHTSDDEAQDVLHEERQVEALAPGVRDRLLSIEALSDWLDVPVWTIRKWRTQGTGPKGIRVGRHVRYRPQDVRKWLDDLAKAA